MSNLQPARGTHDLLFDEMRSHRLIADKARGVAALYGFSEIETPIFEFTNVFSRTLGDTSDVVTKEMYTFVDRSGDSLTLRPEGTAGVARAVISNALTQSLPLKFFYHGPMFRHERPQAGRTRQFHQIGCELIGVAGPQADIEIIALGHHILCELGVQGKATLEINTLGDVESRSVYRDGLVAYLSKYKDDLSLDSRVRLMKNPLRVLDSKDEKDREIVASAPSLADYLNDSSKAFFDSVTNGLDVIGVPFRLNARLVRGLDYYGHTAFEFVTDLLGAQGAIMAGGRYDGLIEQMGGPSTPGIGWAAGVERLSMLAGGGVPAPRPVVIVPTGDDILALTLAQRLRTAGFVVDLGYSGNMKKRLARASKISAKVAIIMGEDELSRNAVTLRDLDKGEQEEVALDVLEQALIALL